MNTKISIISVNLNNKKGLEQTLDSIALQTFRDFEVLVVDGGSTDSSLDVISERGDLITSSISEPDEGIYYAQNKGVLMATGEYCLFLNSGDVFASPSALEDFFRTNPQEDFLFGDVLLEFSSGERTIKQHPDHPSISYLYYEMICHQGQLIKREVLLKLGCFNTKLKFTADYEVMLKVFLKEKNTYQHLPVVLAKYNMSGYSSRPENTKLLLEEKKGLQEQYFSPEMLPLLQEILKMRNENQSLLEALHFEQGIVRSARLEISELSKERDMLKKMKTRFNAKNYFKKWFVNDKNI